MSATNGNGWKPRKIETITCLSGAVVQVRRPGPEFMLRAGKVARTFSTITKQGEGLDGLEVFAAMNDEELAAVLIFARELVCAMLVSPRLVREPRPDSDEIGPDDIGNDFWELFNYAMTGYFGLSVPVGNTEVEVKDLTTFREESSVSRDGDNGASVQPNPEQPNGDPGLGSSA